jgi:STE24 endopeptidase
MLLPFLLCVLILYVPLPLSGPAAPWPVSAAGVGALAVLAAGAGWAGSGLALRLFRASSPLAEAATVRIFGFLKGLVVGLVAADVFILDWPLAVEGLVGRYRWAVLVDDVLLLLPAVVMTLTVMAFQRRLEVRRAQLSLGLGPYLWLRFRVELGIILAPWLALVLLTDLAEAVLYGSAHAALGGSMATGGVLLVLVVGSPLLLRAAWRTTPLPAGPLRDRLEAFCGQHGFRCRDILVWHTHNHLANAGVIGPTPLLRYVLLSDALVSHFSEDEIEAVFAHEVGHIRHHHLGFYLIFAVAFLAFYANLLDLLAAAGWVEPLQNLMGLDMTVGQGVAMLAFAVVYWVLAFGFVSRRMEQQADAFSFAHSSSSTAFLTALDKLGELSPAPRRGSFWRHFSVERRTDFLRRALVHPELLEQVERKALAIKVGVVLLFGVAVARLLVVHPALFGL